MNKLRREQFEIVSPIHVQLRQQMDDWVREEAERRAETISNVVREAITHYIYCPLAKSDREKGRVCLWRETEG